VFSNTQEIRALAGQALINAETGQVKY
jgi:hypothetical protein